MHPQRSRAAVSTFIALAFLAVDACAVGFGAAPPATVLGQALDFAVPLRLEAGESIAPECVAAEVTAGDSRLPPAQVRARIEAGEGGTAIVRVVTVTVIEEPVVAVSVAVGCPARLSRRFVLFADPAPTATSAPIPLPVESQPPAEAQRSPAVAPPPEPRAAAAPPAASPAVAPRRRVEPPLARQGRPQRRAARPAAPSASAAAPPVARLRLDAEEPPPPVVAAAAAAAASAAASAAELRAAATAATARVLALEQAIAKLQAEASADRDTLRQLRQRAAVAGASSDRFVLALWLAVAALALLVLWLGHKLRVLQRERQQGWWNAAAAAAGAGATQPTTVAGSPPISATAGEATTSAEATLSTIGAPTTRPAPLAPGVFTPESAPQPVEPPLPASQRTQPMPHGWREESEGARDVSIEELIDLEQQAEFFIVLGQEEAAVDLLVEHLRSTGGGSPMPYLKLLEIYRRRGDREAYDRTRARFNHRFNAYAPDWDTDVTLGRWLEDYPSIIARLQMAWPSPLDAMAELESLLFRKARGELFDMPAYRDVLFLYSLARDLLDREPLESGNVDVLLPISSEAAGHTQPMSMDDSPEATLPLGMSQLDDHPTVPVDLDLTQPVIPDSLFGEPTQPAPRRRPG